MEEETTRWSIKYTWKRKRITHAEAFPIIDGKKDGSERTGRKYVEEERYETTMNMVW